jgi:hypothetical protein
VRVSERGGGERNSFPVCALKQKRGPSSEEIRLCFSYVALSILRACVHGLRRRKIAKLACVRSDRSFSTATEESRGQIAARSNERRVGGGDDSAKVPVNTFP